MGFYLEPPVMRGKADWLIRNFGAREISLSEAKEIVSDSQEEAVICVVDNGPFEAAGFCYDHQEMWSFTQPDDPRPKRWLAAPREAVIEASGFKGADKA